MTLLREDTRTLWSWMLLEQLAQDIRYGLRTMAANKTFSAMAILSLALGIGANTAIFSFMDSILLRSLPVPDPRVPRDPELAYPAARHAWHQPA